jgi:hypothetical protein
VDLEPASLFLAATHQDWPRAATPLPNQSWVRDSVRQAIQHSLKNPCAGSHFEVELSPPSPPPAVKPVAALRKARTSPRPSAPVNLYPSAWGDATLGGAATASPDVLTAVESGRTDPNLLS